MLGSASTIACLSEVTVRSAPKRRHCSVQCPQQGTLTTGIATQSDTKGPRNPSAEDDSFLFLLPILMRRRHYGPFCDAAWRSG